MISRNWEKYFFSKFSEHGLREYCGSNGNLDSLPHGILKRGFHLDVDLALGSFSPSSESVNDSLRILLLNTLRIFGLGHHLFDKFSIFLTRNNSLGLLFRTFLSLFLRSFLGLFLLGDILIRNFLVATLSGNSTCQVYSTDTFGLRRCSITEPW